MPMQSASTTPIPLNNRQNRLKQNLYIQPNIPLRNILRIQPNNLLKIRNITPATNLPHTSNPRLNRNPSPMMQLILLQLIRQNRSSSSLCQDRDNYFPKKIKKSLCLPETLSLYIPLFFKYLSHKNTPSFYTWGKINLYSFFLSQLTNFF